MALSPSDTEAYMRERLELSRRIFDLSGSVEDYESVFLDFFDDAKSHRFNACINRMVEKGGERARMSKWFRRNIERYLTLADFPSMSEYHISMMYITRLYLQVIYLNLENLSGLNDPEISRLMGLGFYKESHVWWERLEHEEELINVLSMSIPIGRGQEERRGMVRDLIKTLAKDADRNKALLSISERIFTLIKDRDSRAIAHDIETFLDEAVSDAHLYYRLSKVDARDLGTGDGLAYASLLIRMYRLDEAMNVLETIEARLKKMLKIHGGGNNGGLERDMALTYDAMAQVLTLKSQYDEALRMFLRATEAKGDIGEIHYHLGVLYLEMNALGPAYLSLTTALDLGLQPTTRADAEAYLEKIMNEAGGRVGTGDMGAVRRYLEMEARYFQAIQYIKNDNLPKAVENLEYVTGEYPDNVRALAQLALCYILLARFDEAERALRKAVAIDPDYVPAVRNLMALPEIIQEYKADKDYLRRLKENLVEGRF